MAKLSTKDISATITGGYVHIIMPDESSSTGFTSKRIKLEDFISAGGGTWGSITGTLSDQTDLWQILETIPSIDGLLDETAHDLLDHTGLTGVPAEITEITDIETEELDDSLVLSPDGEGGVEWRAESGGGGTPSKLEQGTAYTTLGTLLNESFSGVALSATNWNPVTLPTGATVSDKLIIASGLADWSRYITMAKHYLYDKLEMSISFKAVTKDSGDGWGFHQSDVLVLYNSSIYMKFDQYTGILYFGTTTAANEYGQSQPIDFTAGDNLKLTIKRYPSKTVTILENLTDTAKPKAYGEFAFSRWGTQGFYRLTFLGGQQEFTNITISSSVRNFGSNSKGVVFLGDSITAGSGASSVADRWVNKLMKGQEHLFENIGVSAWLASTFTREGRLEEILGNINAKYLVVNVGYNDKAQTTATATFTTQLETIASTAQGLGYEVIFVSPWPDRTSTNASYVAAMGTAATNSGSDFIDISGDVGVVASDTYIYDGAHPNDSGHELIANSVQKQSNKISLELLTDYANSDILFRDLAFSNEVLPVLGIDSQGRARKLDVSALSNKRYLTIQPTLYRQDTGNIGITGKLLISDTFQQKVAAGQGLQLGFNNGIDDTACSNINITNIGTGGVGYPQAFNNITGLRNVVLVATSLKNASSHFAISGNDNILINYRTDGGPITGSENTVINPSTILSLTSGTKNVLIGYYAGRAITTGNSNVIILGSNPGSSSFANSLSNTIIIGEYAVSGDAAVNNDIILSTGQYSNNNVWIGGRVSGNARVHTLNINAISGTNATGNTFDIRASRGTGTGEPGVINFKFSTPGSSGTTIHSAFTNTLILRRTNIELGSQIVFKAGQFTAAQATALTPADADFIYVTSTDATFTSVGFWGYENGAWVKL
jgi:lysophospholipase L1-like esterase